MANGDDGLGMSFKVGRSAFFNLAMYVTVFRLFLFPFSPFPCVCVCVCVCLCGYTSVCFDTDACLLLSFTMIDTDRDLEQPTETSDSLLVEGSGDSE